MDFLKLLFQCKTNVLLVGDPRQGTYSTNNSSQNKKFKKAEIVNFFEDDSIKKYIEIDDNSLTINYRSCSAICELSNNLYPDLPKTTSGNTNKTGHDGVFLVKMNDIKDYLLNFNPMQLRDSVRTKEIDENYRVITFGKSKGLEFERVLIYPTKPFVAWLKDNNSELQPTSRSKFYVAITRASCSVGIVCDKDISLDCVGKFEKT